MSKTKLALVLCAELEEGDSVLWNGQICEVARLGGWVENHPLGGTRREMVLRGALGRELHVGMIELSGTVVAPAGASISTTTSSSADLPQEDRERIQADVGLALDLVAEACPHHDSSTIGPLAAAVFAEIQRRRGQTEVVTITQQLDSPFVRPSRSEEAQHFWEVLSEKTDPRKRARVYEIFTKAERRIAAIELEGTPDQIKTEMLNLAAGGERDPLRRLLESVELS